MKVFLKKGFVWLSTFCAILFGFFTVFLALLPLVFGDETAVALSPVEQELCILDSDGSSEILIGGDSRALYHLMPSLISDITHKETTNVGQWLHLGGDPTTFINSLKKNPRVLEKNPIIVFSITIDDLNDLGFKGIPLIQILNWSVWDHFRLAIHRPKAYPKFFFNNLLPGVYQLAKNKLKREDFHCQENAYLPARIMTDRGFTPYIGKKTTGFWGLPNLENDYLLEGGQLKNLHKALTWLSKSRAKKIILYNAPIDSVWLRNTDGLVAIKMENKFSQILKTVIAKYPKISLIDFYQNPIKELNETDFYDQTHLNIEGAKIFSQRMGEYIQSLAN